MGKQTICIGENKGADQLRVNREADQRHCFRYSVFYLNPKFQASCSFLCLYRSVCVGPVRKPHCWFSHEAAQILIIVLHDSFTLWVSVHFGRRIGNHNIWFRALNVYICKMNVFFFLFAELLIIEKNFI